MSASISIAFKGKRPLGSDVVQLSCEVIRYAPDGGIVGPSRMPLGTWSPSKGLELVRDEARKYAALVPPADLAEVAMRAWAAKGGES